MNIGHCFIWVEYQTSSEELILWQK